MITEAFEAALSFDTGRDLCFADLRTSKQLVRRTRAASPVAVLRRSIWQRNFCLRPKFCVWTEGFARRDAIRQNP